MKNIANVSSVAGLANVLQDIAYSGLAEYEIDLDLETHKLIGVQVDEENKKVVLVSEEVK